MFPLCGKTASSGTTIQENGCHYQGNVFLSKLAPPNFNNGLQQQKKKTLNKSIQFPLVSKFSLVGIKDSLKNMFLLDGKVTFGESNIW